MTNKGLWFRFSEPGLFDDGDGTLRQWHPRLAQVGELQPEHIEATIIHPSCSQTFGRITVLESRLAQVLLKQWLYNMLATRPPAGPLYQENVLNFKKCQTVTLEVVNFNL